MDIDERLFNAASVDEWKDFYIDSTEPIPMNRPNPRGLLVKVSSYVDTDHAGNKVTRHFHSRILIYL